MQRFPPPCRVRETDGGREELTPRPAVVRTYSIIVFSAIAKILIRVRFRRKRSRLDRDGTCHPQNVGSAKGVERTAHFPLRALAVSPLPAGPKLYPVTQPWHAGRQLGLARRCLLPPVPPRRRSHTANHTIPRHITQRNATPCNVADSTHPRSHSLSPAKGVPGGFRLSGLPRRHRHVHTEASAGESCGSGHRGVCCICGKDARSESGQRQRDGEGRRTEARRKRDREGGGERERQVQRVGIDGGDGDDGRDVEASKQRRGLRRRRRLRRSRLRRLSQLVVDAGELCLSTPPPSFPFPRVSTDPSPCDQPGRHRRPLRPLRPLPRQPHALPARRVHEHAAATAPRAAAAPGLPVDGAAAGSLRPTPAPANLIPAKPIPIPAAAAARALRRSGRPGVRHGRVPGAAAAVPGRGGAAAGVSAAGWGK